MRRKCEFNPSRDEGTCIQGLAVDLDAAIQSGVIIDTGTENIYNDLDIEEKNNVGSRVHDVFEAVDRQSSFLGMADAALAQQQSESE